MRKLGILLLVMMFFSCNAQQLKNISIKNSRMIEANKKEFIGKPLSYVLSKIDRTTIKSIMAVPNKNKSEVNEIVFRQLSYDDYLKTWDREVQDRPTQLVIMFNQNFDQKGKLCRPKDNPKCAEWTKKDNPKCAEWTKEDEQNLGDLIVYDIYVLGKD